jgi:hypothetical protein
LTLLLAGLAVAAGVVAQVVTGLGFSLVSAPLLVALEGPRDGFRLNLVLSALINLVLLVSQRHDVRTRDAVRLIVPAALHALWTAITLSYSYSSGDRVGFVQKLSKKGWLCKTNEGGLGMSPGPGRTPQFVLFAVRDGAVARPTPTPIRISTAARTRAATRPAIAAARRPVIRSSSAVG